MFMRTKFFVAAAALCLTAFTACSDNEVLKPEVGGDNTYLFNEEGKGYIRLSLDVPVAGTRATTPNDNGVLDEYKVKNAWLLLFTGDSESNATFSAAYDMTGNFALVNHDEITSTAQIIQEINRSGITGQDDLANTKLMAYVMLNKPEAIIFDQNSIKLTTAVKSYDKTNASFTESATNQAMKYADFVKLVAAAQTDEKIFTSNGFFMGNSPLSDKNDAEAASAKATTLVPIKASSIYPSRQAAEQGSESTEVYVERAVAKVDVTANLQSGKESFKVGDAEFKYAILGWTLDNTAKQEYITRNVSDFGTYHDYVSSRVPGQPSRFIENGKMDGTADLYRINFAEAPTYALAIADGKAAEYFNRWANPEAVTNWNGVGSENVAYCFENTFDVARMLDYQTTRVIVKAELQKKQGDTDVYTAADFYMRSDKGTNIYADEATVKQDLLADVTSWDFVKDWMKKHNQAATQVSDANFATFKEFKYVNGKLVPELELVKTGWEAPQGTPNAEGLEDLQTEINKRLANITISKYTGGVAYYPVMIRHFNDNETPWKSEWVGGTEPYAATDATAAAKDYLGRYGVVRNTWYEINVNSISKIGTAGIPELPNGGDKGHWDDSVERYLSVKIHTVKWQKRTQNTDL